MCCRLWGLVVWRRVHWSSPTHHRCCGSNWSPWWSQRSLIISVNSLWSGRRDLCTSRDSLSHIASSTLHSSQEWYRWCWGTQSDSTSTMWVLVNFLTCYRVLGSIFWDCIRSQETSSRVTLKSSLWIATIWILEHFASSNRRTFRCLTQILLSSF